MSEVSKTLHRFPFSIGFALLLTAFPHAPTQAESLNQNQYPPFGTLCSGTQEACQTRLNESFGNGTYDLFSCQETKVEVVPFPESAKSPVPFGIFQSCKGSSVPIAIVPNQDDTLAKQDIFRINPTLTPPSHTLYGTEASTDTRTPKKTTIKKPTIPSLPNPIIKLRAHVESEKLYRIEKWTQFKQNANNFISRKVEDVEYLLYKLTHEQLPLCVSTLGTLVLTGASLAYIIREKNRKKDYETQSRRIITSLEESTNLAEVLGKISHPCDALKSQSRSQKKQLDKIQTALQIAKVFGKEEKQNFNSFEEIKTWIAKWRTPIVGNDIAKGKHSTRISRGISAHIERELFETLTEWVQSHPDSFEEARAFLNDIQRNPLASLFASVMEFNFDVTNLKRKYKLGELRYQITERFNTLKTKVKPIENDTITSKIQNTFIEKLLNRLLEQNLINKKILK